MEAGNARMQDSSYFKALRDQMKQGGRQEAAYRDRLARYRAHLPTGSK